MPRRSLKAWPAVAVIVMMAGLALPSAASEGAGEGGGSELFVSLRCQLCHAVPAASIEAKAKSDKVKGPDLGTAEIQLTAEEMTSFIRRESQIDGQEHKKEFKGSDEELAAIVDWLVELSDQARATAGGS